MICQLDSWINKTGIMTSLYIALHIEWHNDNNIKLTKALGFTSYIALIPTQIAFLTETYCG